MPSGDEAGTADGSADGAVGVASIIYHTISYYRIVSYRITCHMSYRGVAHLIISTRGVYLTG